jgi:hypothetical protein
MTGFSVRIYIVALFLTAACSAASAEERQLKIAVNAFTAVNCPDTYPLEFEELISGQIYQIPFMTLLDRQQIEIVAKKNSVRNDGSFDIAYATKLGKILAVDKMILCSIRKDTSCEITVKVIDIASSSVDIIISKKTSDDSGFPEVSAEVVSEIASFYLHGRKRPFNYGLSVSGAFLYPVGHLSHEYYAAAGAWFGFSGMVSDTESLQASVGVYKFFTTEKYISTLNLLTFCVQGQYHIRINSRFSILPSPGGGYVLGQKVYDRIKNRNSGNKVYSTVYFYNPMAVMNVEFRWRILDNTAVYAVFTNQFLGEKSRLNYYPGLMLGTHISF